MSNNKNNKAPFSLENFISVSLLRPLLAKYAKKATILAYHNISSLQDKNKLRLDSVSEDEFERQMRFLRDNSFEVIPLQKLVTNLTDGKKIEEKTVVVTFDDGYKANFYKALPIMQKYNIPATVFLAVDYIGNNKSFLWLDLHRDSRCSEDLTPMNWDEVIKLYHAGIEIGSHSFSHKFLPKMNNDAIEREILQSQAIIAEKIGEKPRAFAFPFSFPVFHWTWPSFKSIVVKALKKGEYTCCCTLLRGHISRTTNQFFLNRIFIGKYDNLKSFHAKLIGGYAWTRVPQMIFQTFVKKYEI